jgi:hypothetical protein
MLIVHIFDVTKMALYLCGFSSKKPQPSLNHEKKKKTNPVEERSTKCLVSTPQNCHGHQK